MPGQFECSDCPGHKRAGYGCPKLIRDPEMAAKRDAKRAALKRRKEPPCQCPQYLYDDLDESVLVVLRAAAAGDALRMRDCDGAVWRLVSEVRDERIQLSRQRLGLGNV